MLDVIVHIILIASAFCLSVTTCVIIVMMKTLKNMPDDKKVGEFYNEIKKPLNRCAAVTSIGIILFVIGICLRMIV